MLGKLDKLLDTTKNYRKNIPNFIYRVTKLSLITCIAFGIVSTIILFRTNSGDAAIVLVFAKSMKNGLFYFGNQGPVGGATSPLWALLLSVFYLPTNEPSFFLIKFFSLFVFILTGFLIYFISKKLLDDDIFSLLSTTLWFINAKGQLLTATLYDAILSALVIIIILYYTFIVREKIFLKDADKTSSWFIFGLIAGILPLVRPELLLIDLVVICYIIYLIYNTNKKQKYLKYLLISIFLALFISSSYYIWLALNTRLLIPSSIVARGMTFSTRFTVKSLIEQLKLRSKLFLDVAFLSYIIFSMLSLIFYKEYKIKRDHIFLCLFISIAIISLFFIKYSYLFHRYIFPIIPLLCITAALGIYTIYKKLLYLLNNKVMNITVRKIIILLMCVFLILVICGFQLRSAYNTYVYSMDIILEKDLSKTLNNVSNRTDSVLLYEIQAQYYLNAHAISLDGIVGGEILPYLKNGSDLSDFLLDYKPDFIVVSEAFNYRVEYKNTILNELYNNDKKIAIGEDVIIKNITFIKIASRNGEDVPGMNTWISLYAINYLYSNRMVDSYN